MQASDIGRNDPPTTDLPAELVRDMDRDALSRLVREVNDNGVSLQQMADRAVDPTSRTTLSKPYFQRLAANTVTTAPTPERLGAIAAALQKPLSVVQRAAAIQFLDYRATELAGYDDDTRIVVAHLAGMTPDRRRMMRRMIEAADREEGDLE
jgi:uncharacterized protein (DUF2236 family)